MANNKEEIKRRVEHAQKQFAAYSARLQEEQRSRQLFPSTMPGDRGPTSPLGGQSPDWEWSGSGRKT
jgi:hypothetical protein